MTVLWKCLLESVWPKKAQIHEVCLPTARVVNNINQTDLKRKLFLISKLQFKAHYCDPDPPHQHELMNPALTHSSWGDGGEEDSVLFLRWCCWSEVQTACAQQTLTLSVHSGNLELSIGVNVLSEAVRCFPGAGLVHAADYFIHILNTHIFRKHSTSDSRDPFFYRLFVSFQWAEPL